VREQQETYCVLYERNAQLYREWSASQLEVARLRAAARAAGAEGAAVKIPVINCGIGGFWYDTGI
jgi:hypothetical protein